MERAYRADNFYFWENKIRNYDEILFGSIDKKKITKDSIIIYIGILDREKGFVRSGWSSHEDVNTALGFLQHVFLPTSFYTWIDRESKGFYIPLSPFDVLKEEVLKHVNKSEDKGTNFDAIRMERAYNYLNSMWTHDKTKKNLKLKKFCNDFNNMWDEDSKRKLFLKIFEKPEEIVDFILEKAEEEFEEVIEEEIDMTIDELRFRCEDIYDKPLINKNLIEVLNNKIPIWF